MNLETFSAKWFTVYYPVAGFCLIGMGIYLILKKEHTAAFILEAADHEKPPALFIRILKYLLFFTLPGLVLSFTPFSWIELLFTVWSLLLVYIAGLQLVRWKKNRALIKANSDSLSDIIRRSGAIMVAVGFATFLLTYLVINRTPV